MTCSNTPLEGLTVSCDGDVPTLAEGEVSYTRVYNAMCGLHYKHFGELDKEAAKSFAERFIKVWQSGGIRPLFKNIVDAATKMIGLLDKNPNAAISAYNLRLLAGNKPKFSQRIKAKL